MTSTLIACRRWFLRMASRRSDRSTTSDALYFMIDCSLPVNCFRWSNYAPDEGQTVVLSTPILRSRRLLGDRTEWRSRALSRARERSRHCQFLSVVSSLTLIHRSLFECM